MTARASAAFCASPAPPIAMGIMPTIIAAAVINTGRILVWPALMAASKAECPFNCCSRAKVTSRIEFADATPTARHQPIPHRTRRRQSQDHDERIAKGLVVHNHQQIDEDRGEQQPDAQIPERVLHALDLSDHLN